MTLDSPFSPSTASSQPSITRRVSTMSVDENSGEKASGRSSSRIRRQVSNEALSADSDEEKSSRKSPSSPGRASPIRCVSEFDKVVSVSGNADESMTEQVEEASHASVAPPFPNPLHDPKMFAQHKLSLQLESELQPMRLILSRLMAHPMHNRKGIFNRPVDPVALGLPDYFDVIEKPMDFGTIKAKLHALAYRTRRDVVDDIRLVLANACKYNPPQNAVHISAVALLAFLEEQLRAFVPELCSVALKVPPPVAAAPTVAGLQSLASGNVTAPSSSIEGATPSSISTGQQGPLSAALPPPMAQPVQSQPTRKSAARSDLTSTTAPPTRRRKKRGARPQEGHDCQWCEGRTCSVCNQGCLYLEPTLLICSGPHCAGAKVRKNSTYYISPDGSRQYCQRCYVGLPAVLPDAGQCDAWRYKQNLLKRKNDEEVVERWLTCITCQKGVHAVCVLYNENAVPKDEFVCPECVHHQSSPTPIRESPRPSMDQVFSFVSGSDHPVAMSALLEPSFCLGEDVLSAELLPETDESVFIQNKVRDRMVSESCPHAEKTVTVRFISDCARSFRLPDAIREHFQITRSDGRRVTPPIMANYKSKAIALFQRLDGLDVCMFCMYVQEYNGANEYEDKSSLELVERSKRVYVAYLDSVEHFRPRSCRTEVYHEVLVSYLATARKRGYETAHIWACPPSRGNSFVFWNHPASQRTPTADRLVAWYQGALSRAISCGVVSDVRSLYETGFQEQLEPLAKDSTLILEGKMECPPFLDGDFWVEEAVRIHAINFARVLKAKSEPYCVPYDGLEDRSRCPALEVAGLIRDRVISNPASIPFRRPVNAAAMKLVDYHRIISHPMDLGTVYARVMLGEYRTLRDVVLDMELVFANAKLYNPKGHVVHGKSDEVSSLFFAELNALVATWPKPEVASGAPWKSFLGMSMNLDQTLGPLAETVTKGEDVKMSPDCHSQPEIDLARSHSKMLLDGAEAIRKRMVGGDAWLLEKRTYKPRKTSCTSKKAPKARKKADVVTSDDAPQSRRRQSWLAEAVGASVRRNRMSCFICSLQPSCTDEEASRFNEYTSSFCPDTTGATCQSAQVADARHALLEFAQFRNLEFDTLRRAKYSSAILLYYLHHDGAPGMIPVCSGCSRDITSVRWHRVSKVSEQRRPRKRPALAGRGTQHSPFKPEELCGSCHATHGHKDRFIPLPVSFRS